MNKNKLGIDFSGTRIYYGKLLKDDMTISESAKDISESDFLNVMMYYLKTKTNNFKNTLKIENGSLKSYEIKIIEK
ncbi:MAG: hypothetical protein ACRC7S_15870 [Cetobacterium sp.]